MVFLGYTLRFLNSGIVHTFQLSVVELIYQGASNDTLEAKSVRYADTHSSLANF